MVEGKGGGEGGRAEHGRVVAEQRGLRDEPPQGPISSAANAARRASAYSAPIRGTPPPITTRSGPNALASPPRTWPAAAAPVVMAVTAWASPSAARAATVSSRSTGAPVSRA